MPEESSYLLPVLCTRLEWYTIGTSLQELLQASAWPASPGRTCAPLTGPADWLEPAARNHLLLGKLPRPPRNSGRPLQHSHQETCNSQELPLHAQAQGTQPADHGLCCTSDLSPPGQKHPIRSAGCPDKSTGFSSESCT